MDEYFTSNTMPPQQKQRQPRLQSEGLHQQIQHQQQLSDTIIGLINPAAVSDPQMPPQSSPPTMSRMTHSQLMIMGDSFDDIIRSNWSEMHRRNSIPHAYGSPLRQDESPPRMSSTCASGDAMAFVANNSDLSRFPFTQQVGSSYSGINTGLGLTDQMGGLVGDAADYPGIFHDLMGSMNTPYLDSMEMSQMQNYPSFSLFPVSAVPVTGVGGDPLSGAIGSSQMPSVGIQFPTEPARNSSSITATSNATPGSIDDHPDGMLHHSTPRLNAMNPLPGRLSDGTTANSTSNDFGRILPHFLSGHISTSELVIPPPHGTVSRNITQPSSGSGPATPVATSTPQTNKEKTIYSKSGFDMLKALCLVATRKDPKIHLGAVDLSCAFVVCDVTMNDCPIVYASDSFQVLTGYSRHDIIGQNCRFLQAPDGKVEAGSKREFVDDGAVYNLKKMIQEGREVQQSLINYRKGGDPFLNLLTMIPIPWDTDEIRYFIGFQIDLVECPDAISGQELGAAKINYKHSDIGQYIWTPPASSQCEPDNEQRSGADDVSTYLRQFSPKGLVSDWHKQFWDKMLLENTDDVVHILSLKGLFLYLSPSSKRVLEYDAADLIGNSLSSVCHPSDIVPVMRELRDATAGTQFNIVFRIRRKQSGYTWFESHGSLFAEPGKGRKCIILVGRKRPVFALSRRNLEANGGVGDSEMWTKLSTTGLFLFVPSHARSLLDLQPELLIGTSIQSLMRKESHPEFGRSIEQARRGKIVTCKHEVQNRRGHGLQAQTTLYPGDASEGQKPSFLLAQTKLLKASLKSITATTSTGNCRTGYTTPHSNATPGLTSGCGKISQPGGGALAPGTQDAALAAEDNIFDELRTTKCSSWQFELRQMEKVNRILAEELSRLLTNRNKRNRRKRLGKLVRDCANCHTRNTPEWRRGPSGQRDLCNSCGLRWAKQTGRTSPRNSSRGGNSGNGYLQSKTSASPINSSPSHKELPYEAIISHATTTKGDTNRISINSSHLGPYVTHNNSAESTSTQKSTTAMPPPSQHSLSSGIVGSGITSICEEQGTSQQ